MDSRLQDYIDKLTLVTRDGKIGSKREAFKNFYVSNHGIGLGTILAKMQERTDSRTLATPRLLGFLRNSDLATTEVGTLLKSPCIDKKRVLNNQYKKWHFPNPVNYAGEFNIYPYWIILEFLVEAKRTSIDYITNEEFLAFVSVIRSRNSVNEHLNLLRFIRENSEEAQDFYDAIPDKENFFQRFSKSGFHELLSDCLEHISYSPQENKIFLSHSDLDFLSNQISYFYSTYDCFADYRKDEDYLIFLQSNFIDNNFSLLPMPEKNVDGATFNAVSNSIKNEFAYKNLLLKGVPGTGKSRELDEIINNKIFALKEGVADNPCLSINDLKKTNVIRINVHSGLTNAELMQGIGVITTTSHDIKYQEKQGLVLKHIAKAILNPSLPYVIILEEVQENNLNRLIGDLIFLIEEKRRTVFTEDYREKLTGELDFEFVSQLTLQKAQENKVLLPSLVEKGKEIYICLPSNLFIFCTTNYRDDKRIMEDNLLRRFEVVEIYPDETPITSNNVKSFFKKLNKAILEVFQERQELHPDRYLCGHAIWIDVSDKATFARALNKVAVEFKDIREIDWSTYKEILTMAGLDLNALDAYKELHEELQNIYFWEKPKETPLSASIDRLLAE
jgi:hypothetical protein